MSESQKITLAEGYYLADMNIILDIESFSTLPYLCDP